MARLYKSSGNDDSLKTSQKDQKIKGRQMSPTNWSGMLSRHAARTLEMSNKWNDDHMDANNCPSLAELVEDDEFCGIDNEDQGEEDFPQKSES